jgi:hypothetical protein
MEGSYELNEPLFLDLMEKVIGETKYLQNNPPEVRRLSKPFVFSHSFTKTRFKILGLIDPSSSTPPCPTLTFFFLLEFFPLQFIPEGSRTDLEPALAIF